MTSQVREKLILDGVEQSMAFCPDLPIATGQVIETSKVGLGQSIKTGEWPRILQSTACWRGYIGTWEIKDERLYLNKVIGRYQMTGSVPVFAEWITAVLRVPQGKVIQPVNMGFASVCETELHIKIEKGVVVKQRLVDNSSKKFDGSKLAFSSLPGSENRFDGDDF